jgi:hypothetical protein
MTARRPGLPLSNRDFGSWVGWMITGGAGVNDFTPVESWRARDLYPEHNAVVAAWMADHGWPVTKAPPSLSGEIFAWIHESSSGRTYTLRITREALDYFSADDLGRALNRLHTDRELRDAPRGAVILHFDKGAPCLIVAS